MASIYTNLDPGTNKLADTRYQSDMKQYKFGLTKTFNEKRRKISLFYKYNLTQNATDGVAPFIFVGDGSVREYNGFRMGRDGFLPVNGQITYLSTLDIYRESISKGLTTWPETSNLETTRSDCHAWGASPNIEFYRIILGIASASLGFSTVRIMPSLGDIQKIGGSIP